MVKKIELQDLKKGNLYSYIINYYNNTKLLYVFRFDHIEPGRYGFHIYDSGALQINLTDNTIVICEDDNNVDYIVADYEVLSTLHEVQHESLLGTIFNGKFS